MVVSRCVLQTIRHQVAQQPVLPVTDEAVAEQAEMADDSVTCIISEFLIGGLRYSLLMRRQEYFNFDGDADYGET